MACVDIGGLDLNADFMLEVRKGNVDGHTSGIISGRKVLVPSNLETIWGASGDYAFPTAPESWEVVSDNANDTSAGTGARTVLVSSLDEDYNRQTQLIFLNGTTPVACTGTHLRAHTAISLTAGSGKTNAGEIVIRVAGGGATRNVLQVGKSITSDGIFTVPAGKTLFINRFIPFFPKNQSGLFAVASTASAANSSRLIPGEFTLSEGALDIITGTGAGIAEKTDIELLASSANPNQRVDIAFEFILIDNTELP